MTLQSKEQIGGFQLKVYRLSQFSDAELSVVKRGRGHGRVIFQSYVKDEAKSFITEYDNLIDRKFDISEKGATRTARAWFEKSEPTQLFDCSTYSDLSGTLVRFKEPIDGEAKGFIKIY